MFPLNEVESQESSQQGIVRIILITVPFAICDSQCYRKSLATLRLMQQMKSAACTEAHFRGEAFKEYVDGR